MKPVVIVVLGIAVVAIPIFSQAPPEGRRQFEVVSIKVHPPPLTQIAVTAPPGRYVAVGVSLRMLVGQANGVPEVRVVGGPSWIQSERYDIEAKAADTIPQGEMPLYLRSLLEDRFQLKSHKETRELPVYELVVARSGSKLKLSEDQTPAAPLPQRGGGRGGPGAGLFGGGPPPRGAFSAGRGNLQGSAVALTTLINFLTTQLGRPVYDKTGLAGLFDLKLEWTPGAEQVPGPFAANPNAPPPPADSSGPSIFTALQEQLGLRLESTKGPVEVVVIDNVEKPAEN